MLKKIYTPIAKFPPIIEDIRIEVKDNIKTTDIIDSIREQSNLIKSVSLLDRYESLRTFHIIFQDKFRNLTTDEIEPIRKQIIASVEKSFKATLK